MRRCPEVKITWHTDFVQNFPREFFAQFQVIVAGLDNIEARRWINSMVHSLEGVVLIDGGSEAFSGQCRVIVPGEDACYECMLSTLPPETSYPLCTVKEIPRQPEHCIQYAYMIEWPEHFKRAVDKDSPVDMQWICKKG